MSHSRAWRRFFSILCLEHPKASCLEAICLTLWWQQEQRSGCLWALGVLEFLHICGEEALWRARVSPLGLQVAFWGRLWAGGLVLPLWALALPHSSFHSLPYSQEEGRGRVGNKLSLCSAFDQLRGILGSGQSCQGKHWNSELHVEWREKVSRSGGRARKLAYLL